MVQHFGITQELAESDNEDEQSEESSKKGEVELNAMKKTLQNGNNEPQSSQHNKVFKDQHKTWGNQGAPNYPNQNQMNNPQFNAIHSKTIIKETTGTIKALKETIAIVKETKAIIE